MTVHGSQRIGDATGNELSAVLARNAHHLVKTSPGWAEVTYPNRFTGDWTRRDLLLGWVMATIRGQHEFALELALKGRAAYEINPSGNSAGDLLYACDFGHPSWPFRVGWRSSVQ